MATNKKTSTKSNKSTRLTDDQHTIKSNVGQRAHVNNQQVDTGIAKSQDRTEGFIPKKK
ncbi:MAG TPA: hypothetical protein VL947_02235 [Cytophagales bacterium]|nr:hypothetical protein [Cytophagales bacterium]